MANQQLTHLAERANQAAVACGYKDDELKRTALENQVLIQTVSEKAEAEKAELERRLHLSMQQCQRMAQRANEDDARARERAAELNDDLNSLSLLWLLVSKQRW